MIIRGSDDLAFCDHLFADLTRYLAQYREVVVPNASHWLQHDASAELNQELESFLDQLESKAK